VRRTPAVVRDLPTARPVFTDAMLTVSEHTIRAVRAGPDIELVGFNGDTDYVHLQVCTPADDHTLAVCHA
jgi:hypothetical protein